MKKILFALLFCSAAYSKKIEYKTIFGSCPSRIAGNLTLKLLKEFDEAVNGSSKEHKPKAQGFFDGVKNFFDDYLIINEIEELPQILLNKLTNCI